MSEQPTRISVEDYVKEDYESKQTKGVCSVYWDHYLVDRVGEFEGTYFIVYSLIHTCEVGGYVQLIVRWHEPAAPAPEAATGAGEAGVFATGLSALRREGGSISVYQDLGGVHNVIVDTLDYENRMSNLTHNSNIDALKITEQGIQIATLQAELAASRERERVLAAAVEPFDAIWADWQAYCKETKKSKQLYKNITSWIQGTFPIENVATWIREAAAVVRKQATESGNR